MHACYIYMICKWEELVGPWPAGHVIVDGCFFFSVRCRRSVCIGQSQSEARSMSVVWSREVSASRRFQMYYLYGKINQGHGICPLYGGSPLFRGSAIRGFTVQLNSFRSQYES